MNKYLQTFVFIFIPFIIYAKQFSRNGNLVLENNYATYFEEAYHLYPTIPRGYLEAFAYHNTRIRNNTLQNTEQSCVQMPFYYGVMGLVEDGKGVFKNNLETVSNLSGYSKNEIKTDARVNILAFAKAYSILLAEQTDLVNHPKDKYIRTLEVLSELPTNNTTDYYIKDIQLYGILSFLNNTEFQSFYHTSQFNYDLKNIFGEENYNVLSATQVDIETNQIRSSTGYIYRQDTSNNNNIILGPCTMPTGPVEYATALWDAAASTNYGGSITPDMVAIHTMQGSYAGSISWFKNTSASVSAQYCVRSYDGQVTQMVCNKRKAYHVGNSNAYSVGIEQEAYAEDGLSWFTNAMYASVGNLINAIAVLESVQKLKMYYGPPVSGLMPLSNTCYKIKGHQHYPSNTHVDPGPYYDWERLYRLVNPLPALSFSSTALSGTFYDAGGAGGNYADATHNTFLIDPATNNPIRVTFTSWNVEANYDYLYIYDGNDNNGRFIGKYSTNPGTVTAYSGAMFFEFRSDCATNYAGWTANWTTDASAPACTAPQNLTITPQALTASLSWSSIASASLYEIRYKTYIEANWIYKQTTATNFILTGLEANSIYQCEIRSKCGADSSGWIGNYFNTDRPGNTLQGSANYNVNSCNGDFRDSGGKSGGYTNREDWTYTIQPSGATAITINFTSFLTETTNDVLRIYDGASTSSTLIGTYSGTTSPGTVVSSGGALTFRFTSSSWTIKSGWEATWTCTTGASVTNPTTTIMPLQEWYTGNFLVTFKDSVTCASGLNTAFYNVANFNGTSYSSNASNGFFYDNFSTTTINPNWTINAGTWNINTNALYQSDQVLTNTNIYTPLLQTNTTYLYHFKMKINGSGTNKRAGLHFFCDNPALSNRGNSYLVYFRDDNNTVQIYKCTGNVISAPLTNDAETIPTNTWFDVKIIYNATTGVITVYKDDVAVSTYTDATPLTSGSSISFRTGECEAYFDDFIVYKSRGNTATVSVGAGSTNDVQYQNINPTTDAVLINDIIIDKCAKWSTKNIAYTNIDYTPPTDTFRVNDGIAADIDITTETSNFYANWTPSADTNSGVVQYYYQIGTTPGGSNVIPLTDNGTSTYLALTGLSLSNGVTYYITVIAKNAAGLFSNPVTSDGVLVNAACTTLPSTAISIAPTYNNWVTNDFTASYADQTGCSCPLKFAFYNVSDYNGNEWLSNSNYGFFNDNFDNNVINPIWTAPSGYGTWTNTVGQLVQTDETLTNTNIYASVNQIPSEVYMYEWTAVLDGVGGNRRAGLHFMCDNPSWPNRGNSYFVWFRADQDNMQIYKTSGATPATNVFGSVLYQVPLDVQVGIPYNYKVIYQPNNGTITVFRDDIYIGQWKDPTPLTSGNSISCRTGNSKAAYDDIRVYKSRGTNTLVTVGNNNELRYENIDSITPAGNIRTILLDTCKRFSIPLDKEINIDTTAPNTITIVNDGTGIDEDLTTSTTVLSGNFSNSFDPNSGIAYYEYAIGSTSGDSDIVNWTNIGLDTNFTASGLSLLVDSIYYIIIRTRNAAGIYSIYTVSDGIKVILALPVELISFTGKYIDNYIGLNWITASEHNAKEYVIERSTDGVNFYAIGTVPANGFSNNIIHYYYNDSTINSNTTIYYYRLKNVDLDNSFSYTSIIEVHIKSIATNTFVVYPNPFSDALNISIQLVSHNIINIQLIDFAGKTILSKKYDLNEGNTLLQLNETADLPKGIYFILVDNNHEILLKEKVVKQ